MFNPRRMIVTDSVKNKMQTLRTADFKNWVTTFWLIKRKLVLQQAKYTVLKVDTDSKLEAKLKKAVTSKISSKNYKLDEYEFLTADQDDGLLTIDSVGTDVSIIQAEIDKGTSNKKVEKYDDLLDSWSMCIKLEFQGKAIYAFKKINTLTKATKLAHISFFQFKDQELKDLDEKQIFTIDTGVDFFSFESTIFIINKKEFETALNFRAGMEKNRDDLLQEFLSLKIFNDVDLLKRKIGSNLHLLRKISSIQKSGYYKNKDFLANLIKVSAERGWGLIVENDVIVINDETIDLVLKLLENGRLESPINHEIFDASVKKKVT